MVERSRFWNGTTVGDAVQAPYDAPDEFAGVLRSMVNAEAFASKGVVFPDSLSELLVAASAPNVSVAPGRAMVHGSWYENDTFVALDTSVSPAGTTRIDRVVLRKSWVGQTVRAFKIIGIEGAGVPALVQTPGVTWDMPLALLTCTVGGAITVTDQRNFLQPPMPPAVKAARTTSQTFIDSRRDCVIWDGEYYKNDSSMHNLVTNPHQLIAPRAGLYAVSMLMLLFNVASPTNIHYDITIRVNGVGSVNVLPDPYIYSYILEYEAPDSGFRQAPAVVNAYIETILAAGDHIDATLFQAGGSPSLNLATSPNVYPWLSLRYIMPTPLPKPGF